MGTGWALRFFPTQASDPPVQTPAPQTSNLAITAHCGKAGETPDSLLTPQLGGSELQAACCPHSAASPLPDPAAAAAAAVQVDPW